MTNPARTLRAPATLSRSLLPVLCMTVAAVGALGASASASAHGNPQRNARAHLASLVPLQLKVVGSELTWPAVQGVRKYEFARQRSGQASVHRLVESTSVRLRPFPGESVTYSVRTNVRGSAWASPITVVFGHSGTIVQVLGENTGSSGSGSGGSPGSGSGSGSRSEGGSGSGSGSEGGSGSGSGSEGGSGSGSGSGSEGGSGSGSGSEGGSGSGSGSGGGSGSEETHTTGLKVGLIGGIYGWGKEVGETIHKATGVKFSKAGVPAVWSAEGWLPIEEVVREGVSPLILYNPILLGMSPTQVGEGVRSYISHMHALGLTEMELGNEVYYHGSTPWEYAAQYKAAHEALAGSGITLIADAWTDTPNREGGGWSQWEAGGGWCVLFVQALGYVPDAWSFHPYGPMSADGFGSGAYRTGWATVPRMIAYMKADHVYAPLNITEVGQPTYEGSDGNTAVSEAEQAQDIKQYLRQSAEWGLASIYLYEAIDTGEGGYGLYKWPLQAKPSEAAYVEAVSELSAKSALDTGNPELATLSPSAAAL
jgi:hypothetical protein